jgi:hypothetical protein
MPPSQHKPVVSFGNELLQVLIKASKERVELNFTTERGGFASATSFRQRIYGLRTAMRKHNHEHYDLVSGVKALIRWPPDTPTTKVGRGNIVPKDPKCPVTLIIGPQDLEFAEVIRDAGIVDPFINPTPSPTTDEAPLAPTVTPKRDITDDDEILDRILRTKGDL